MNTEFVLLVFSIVATFEYNNAKSTLSSSQINFNESPEWITDKDLFTSSEEMEKNLKSVEAKETSSSMKFIESPDLLLMLDDFFMQAFRSIQSLDEEKLESEYTTMKRKYINSEFLKKLEQGKIDRAQEVLENLLPLASKLLEANNKKREQEEIVNSAMDTAPQSELMPFTSSNFQPKYQSRYLAEPPSRYPNFPFNSNLNFKQFSPSNNIGSYFKSNAQQDDSISFNNSFDEQKSKIQQLDDEIDRMAKDTSKVASLVQNLEKLAAKQNNKTAKESTGKVAI